MSVTLDWDNPEKTILVYTLSGKWTMHEFKNALQSGIYLQADLQHAICMVLDLRASRVPTRTCMNYLNVMRNLTMPDTLQRIIILGKSSVLPIYIDMIHSVSALRNHEHDYDITFARDMEAARELAASTQTTA